jgi:Na+/H+ antiporter NhaD/arsenite permease-like protein
VPPPALTVNAPGTHSVAPPHPLWTLPFLTLLLAIAVLPLVPAASHWWEQNRNKLLFSAVLSVLVLAHYAGRGFGFHDGAPGASAVVAVSEHALLRDYAPFMALLASLYVISGGLLVLGDLRARPALNTAFLGLGAVLASLLGTTGASMILIRPILQTNRERKHVRHTVVFFIFLVSNVGGCLLPVGDPPLFLGYLQGVPFLWTLSLFGPWLFCVLALLAVYYVWDTLAYRHESPEDLAADDATYEPPRLRGAINLVWLVGVVLSVALIVPGRALPGTDLVVGEFVREGVMLGLIALSLVTTPRELRRASGFSFAPIAEVACLFLGIFVTMQVPIEILQARGAALGLSTPSHFFWAAGSLSSVLDNAPTYAVFFEAARAMSEGPTGGIVRLLDGGAIRADLLSAVSLGSVFMGANTYIGNGPNFMVKSIAEKYGVAMPSFFGYMLYSGCVLLPLFALVSFLFFRS